MKMKENWLEKVEYTNDSFSVRSGKAFQMYLREN